MAYSTHQDESDTTDSLSSSSKFTSPLVQCMLDKSCRFARTVSQPASHPFQVADAALADGLHQLIVGRPHGGGRPAALLPFPVPRHRPQGVLQLLQDAVGLVFARPFALLGLLPFCLGRLLVARLVGLDDLRNHPCGLLLLVL